MEDKEKIEYHKRHGYLMVKINIRWTVGNVRWIIDEAKNEILKKRTSENSYRCYILGQT
ncbi:MAG TPA: hypothetical protein PKN50_00965 [Spirochaetota bacterium]|nr:hypothetical protein [Spirochaetota bacterium]HPV40308.1 hypothetical protein [Spirochaetota bacterium]